MVTMKSKKLKNRIRKTFRRGLDILRHGRDQMGIDPFLDMQRLMQGHQSPVIFDVGANIGQSVDRFKGLFPTCRMHSFEPSPSTFQKLQSFCDPVPDVQPWNLGIGSVNSTLTFSENDHSHMSSFLQPSEMAWGQIVKSTEIPVVTLDRFATDQKIDFIHLLKSDTQGYDFEVFKGARQLMTENRIGLVYFEFIFSDMYKNLPSFDDVYCYLIDNNFSLVSFYTPNFQRELVSWTDVLFINREFYQQRQARLGSTLKAA
jgi:FkbM family methyltransferase